MGRNEELRLELRNAQIEISKTVTELDSRAQNVRSTLHFNVLLMYNYEEIYQDF